MGFKKIQIWFHNPKCLAFDFTQKRYFAAKTNRNSVFLGRKVQMSDHLHIMVSYICFYGFKNIKISSQNPKGLAFAFTKKASLRQKLTETLYFMVIIPIFWIGYT
jgi:hypothetical protein